MRLTLLTLGLSLLALSSFSMADDSVQADLTDEFASLPTGLTSFGAARANNAIYVYGGHTGTAHTYSVVDQSNKLLKLDLDSPKKTWETVSTQHRVQGNALVAYGNKLICVGGFTANNAEEEDQDLHSQRTVAAFDIDSGEWSELAKLPKGRSSHDAIIMGDKLYVVGGWTMDSPKETVWQKSALVLDLATEKAKWKRIAPPPFQRRALAIAGFNSKLYVIGGMDKDAGPTRKVEVYDPTSDSWNSGPAILGTAGMTGFGVAACEHSGRLVISCYAGELQSLNPRGTEWSLLGRTKDARFFHRLVPIDDHHLLAVGGASMDSGKFESPEVIKLPTVD